jgi:metal-responsive CopG/Arc/MetJ family transcriptional regulator
MKRITIYIDENLVKEIKETALSKKRSLSFMISVLLQQAVKEKNRKKVTATKEVHT